MTNVKNRKEETLIRACILRSENIAILHGARISNRNLKFFTGRTLEKLSCTDHIQDTEEEIDNKIDDHKMSIARSLRPLFALHGINLREGKRKSEENFWFSNFDLDNGYVTLCNDPREDSATHILFLKSFKEHEAGSIKPFNQVAHLLRDIGSVWSSQVIVKMINETQRSCKKMKSA